MRACGGTGSSCLFSRSQALWRPYACNLAHARCLAERAPRPYPRPRRVRLQEPSQSVEVADIGLAPQLGVEGLAHLDEEDLQPAFELAAPERLQRGESTASYQL